MSKVISKIAPQCRKIGLVPAAFVHARREAAQKPEAAMNSVRRNQTRRRHTVIAFNDRERSALIDSNQKYLSVVYTVCDIGTQRTQLGYIFLRRIGADFFANAVQHIGKIKISFRQASPVITREDPNVVKIPTVQFDLPPFGIGGQLAP